MTKVFISYSRKDKVFAGRLTEAFQKSELETWIDWEDIPPTADWMDQIHKGIEQADAFLFLLSPDSVASKVCGQEVDHAVQNGKRLIPIVARDVNPNDVHPALAKVNWIYCRETDDFDSAVNKTLSAIRTDLAWVEAHKRLQVRAIEWDKRKDRSLLLRGKDLGEAEERLASAGQKDPQPTDLQRHYVLASRNGETRTRNMVLAIAAVVMVALAVLSVFAVNQRNAATDNALTAVANEHVAQTAQANAEQQARMARARELTNISQSTTDNFPQRKLLLEISALDTLRQEDPRIPALETLMRNSLALTGGIPLYVKSTNFRSYSFAFSPDEHWFSWVSENGELQVLDLQNSTGKQVVPDSQTGDDFVVTFSPDGQWLTLDNNNGMLRVWDLGNLENKPLVLSSTSRFEFSPDGRWLMSKCAETRVCLWDAQNLENRPSSLDEISYFSISPDGHWLASSCGIDSICLHNLQNLKDDMITLLDSEGSYSRHSFSPDGHWMIGEGFDAAESRAIWRVWDLKNPTIAPETLFADNSPVNKSYFSPNGRWFASWSGASGGVKIWDMQDLTLAPEELDMSGELTGESTTPPVMVFSPDGRWLVSQKTKTDGIKWINVWDLDRLWYPPVELKESESVIPDSFFPDGSWLVAKCAGNEICLWSAQNLYAEPVKLLGHEANIQALEFSPFGRWFASAGDDAVLRLWDSRNLSLEPVQFNIPAKSSLVPALSSTGQWLAVLGMKDENETGSLLYLRDLWNPGKETNLLDIPELPVEEMFQPVFSPDGQWLTLSCASYMCNGIPLYLWDLKSMKTVHPNTGVSNAAYSVIGFSPDGKWLVASDYNAIKTYFWDLQNLSNMPIILGGKQGNYIMPTFSPDKHWLATLGVKNGSETSPAIFLWDARKLDNPSYDLNILAGTVFSLNFSTNGRWLEALGWSDDNGNIFINLWDMQNVATEPVILPGINAPRNFSLPVFSPDGRWLARNCTADPNNTCERTGLYIWDLKNPDREPVVLENEASIVSFAISPNGQWLAVIYESGLFHIYKSMDVSGEMSFSVSKELNYPDISVEPSMGISPQIAFSPDSQWLSVDITDGTIRVWDMSNLDLSPVDLGSIRNPSSLSYTPDGKWLVWDGFGSWTWGKTIKLWHTNIQGARDIACQTVGRNFTRAEWAQYFPGERYHATCPQWPLEPEIITTPAP